jgi:hypothetical protein
MTEDEWNEVRDVQLKVIRGNSDDRIVYVKISAQMFDQIIQQAKRRDRSVAAMIEMLLREAIQSREISQRGAAQ